MTSLDGRAVLVVGANGGLGRPLALQLASEGVRLAVTARDAASLADLPGVPLSGDLRTPGDPARLVTEAVAALGGLDGLVIASGIVAFGPAGQVPDDVLTDLFLVNTLGPIRLVDAALPALAESAAAGNAPFVVTISAVVAEQPTAGMAAYSASKAALTAYDSAAGRELRRAGIRLIDARPPHTETGLAERPASGVPPRLPEGLQPVTVSSRILRGVLEGERDLPSSAFVE